MSVTLYRKYRPQVFADVVGQKHIVQTLSNALKLGRIGQAYLFTGPRGTGKTTLARLFAKAVNCSKRKGFEPCGKCEHCILMSDNRSLDVIEIDAASHTGVDNIRELRETIVLPPTLGSHKIYIIDEVHMLSIGAFNALLKTLEEPPAHVIFILATTALHKVPDTIVSRCQCFDLSRFPVKSIVGKLEKIAKAEKLDIDREALEMIALSAEGGMRDAESLLTQIASLDSGRVTEERVAEILGTTKKENIVVLLRLIGDRALYPSLSFVTRLSQDGVDLSIFSGALLHYLRDLLLVAADPKNGPAELDGVTDEQQATILELAAIFSPADVVRMLEYFQIAQTAGKTAVIPELPLQIAIVKILSVDNGQGTQNIPPSSALKKDRESLPVHQTKNIESQGKERSPSLAPSAVEQSQQIPDIASSSSKNGEARETNDTDNTVVDLSDIRDKWQSILDTAKGLNASLTLALSTAKPTGIDGSTVIIAVKYPFHKERLDESTNRLTLKKAFDTILTSRMNVRIVLDDARAEKRDESFLSNPLVSQAMELLGGKIS